jgi:predicted nucleotidyltransferase
MNLDLKEIIEISGIHPLKVRNVYVFGSRVYGYNRESSDFDIILVAPNLEKHKEIRGEKYNIHIVTPDSFKDELFRNHKITYLECIFAPDWAKLQEKEKYDLSFNKDKVKKEILAQSYSTWRNAKQKMIEGDILRGTKSAFHALKILKFGIQILNHGKIVNFSECNDLYNEFENKNYYEWYQIKEDYLDFKKELENQLKQL